MSLIDVLPSDDQLEIVSALARPLADLPPGGGDLETVGALGFVGAGLPEESGGLGLSIADETLLHIELGRRVAAMEVLAAGLAARVAAANGELNLAASLTSGAQSAGFAVPVSSWSGRAPTGEVHLVGRGDVYLAVSAAGAALLKPTDLKVSRTVEGMDALASTVRADIIGAPAWLQARGVPIWQLASLFIAAQLSGLALAARDMGAEYAKTRSQFDKPIGSFQAIAHPLADCAVRAEAAYNQVLFAAIKLRDGAADAEFQVTAAILVAMDAAFQNATTNIQTHGAMGFAAATGAHLYLKRAVVLRHVAGGARLHEQAMLEADAPQMEKA
jgi:alkylation response protein AidB-like acyl-CoA dehydrogenase